ncbi:MAG: PEP-CTERM sorting domain-containing protein [Rhodocyclaceae bacterium]|nr:PEP-CTERM sorting domain-containing protein [Rhodocyclaceae bacterium]MCB1962320.1 PEP-CTERM sorting domain-containing protein [Rhodocyclaceae bacterium]
MTIKKSLIALAVASTGIMAAGSAHALLIDPDGAGGVDAIDVSALGWNNGNAISTPLQTTNGTVNGTATGDTIRTYGHAALQGFNDANGNNIFVATNPANWTYVFGFDEVVTTASDAGSSSNRVFRTTNSASSFFEIWVGGDASLNLSGKGFNGDGGAIKILSGTIADFNALTGAGQTSFNSSAANPNNDLDQFNANNYTDYKTVSGTGGGSITVTVDSFDNTYFLTDLSFLTLNIVTDTFQNLPYQQTDPSSCFWDGAAYFTGAGNGIANGCGVASDFGTIGSFNGVNGTNTMFQTRATTAFPVPEPTSMALVGLGLLAAGAVRRKKS